LNDLPNLQTREASAKQSSIRCCNETIALRSLDVSNTILIANKNNLANREGYLGEVLRVIDYLKSFSKGSSILGERHLDHSKHKTDHLGRWKRFYPKVEERVPPDMPKSKVL